MTALGRGAQGLPAAPSAGCRHVDPGVQPSRPATAQTLFHVDSPQVARLGIRKKQSVCRSRILCIAPGTVLAPSQPRASRTASLSTPARDGDGDGDEGGTGAGLHCCAATTGTICSGTAPARARVQSWLRMAPVEPWALRSECAERPRSVESSRVVSADGAIPMRCLAGLQTRTHGSRKRRRLHLCANGWSYGAVRTAGFLTA